MFNVVKIFLKKPSTWKHGCQWSIMMLNLYTAAVGAVLAHEKSVAYKDRKGVPKEKIKDNTKDNI